MLNNIEEIELQINNFPILSGEDLEKFQLHFLVKKGIINALFAEIKNISPEERKSYGEKVNHLKNLAESKYNNSLIRIQEGAEKTFKEKVDLTLPPPIFEVGSRHPVSIIRKKIIDIFSRIGFTVVTGPEIETDWYNFTALNFEPDHPARDMQDTFFIEKNPDILLRTHTSTVQIRVMEKQKPPIRILAAGRTFRNEAISARAHCMFHQIEGLYVDKGVSIGDLKQTILFFAKEMFGSETEIRVRGSYFPFTEPSVEMDISCLICGGKGCPVCKQSGWVEIMGAGMVDPAVLENCKINPDEYTGFAFGMGIERITMLKYGIHDLRLFTENDLRFLKQFVGVI